MSLFLSKCHSSHVRRCFFVCSLFDWRLSFSVYVDLVSTMSSCDLHSRQSIASIRLCPYFDICPESRSHISPGDVGLCSTSVRLLYLNELSAALFLTPGTLFGTLRLAMFQREFQMLAFFATAADSLASINQS